MPLGPWTLPLPSSLLGSLRIEAFGIALAFGFVLGVLMSARLAELAGLERNLGADVLVFALFGALFGGRLLFAVENARNMSLRDFLSLGQGGLSAYGAFLFAALAAGFWLRRRGQPAAAWFDIAAPGALLVASVARLGSHLGAGVTGRPLSGAAPAWLARLGTSRSASAAAASPEALTLSGAAHPSALYEAFGTLVLVALLLGMRRYQRRSGDLALLSVLGYSALRLLSELSRERTPALLGLTLTEWYALTTAAFAGALVLWRHQRGEYST